VLGTHRSGSSLCAHLMQALGFDMSDQARPDPHNEKGYWEHLDIMIQQDHLLNALGRNFYTAAHALPLPPEWWKRPVVKPIKRTLKSYLTSRMASSRRLAFKDPRTVRFLPMWFEIFRELSLTPKFIMCLRNPMQVARSLHARDGFDIGLGEYLWMLHAVDFFRYTTGQSRCIIEYDDWFSPGMPNLKKLADFLEISLCDIGGAADIAALAANIVDPALRHDDDRSLEQSTPYIQTFYNLTKHLENEPHFAAAIEDAVVEFERFQASMRPFEPMIASHIGAARPPKEDRRGTAAVTQLESPRPPRPGPISKIDIVNLLARKHRLSRYLEICTTRTGHQFAEVDRKQLATSHRLMYRCPPDYFDGLPIDFRSPNTGVRSFFDEFARLGTKYDIILADSWHTYECSKRDLRYALATLDEGGFLVVHDCDPPESEMARSSYRSGEWCGVTYAAFVDFVLERDDIDYYTVDTDFGCAVVRKRPSESGVNQAKGGSVDAGLRFLWNTVRGDETLRYTSFKKVNRELLHIVSVAEFLELEGIDPANIGGAASVLSA
jgi:hypothetical protein